MENSLDKLFRNKLSGHEEAPSSQAWQQVHQNLKSKKRRLWIQRISIAASIFLIATAGFIGYQMLHKVGKTSEMTNSVAPIKEQTATFNMVEEDPQEIKGDESIPEEQQDISEQEIQNIEQQQKKTEPNQEIAFMEKQNYLVESKEEIVEIVKDESVVESEIMKNKDRGLMEQVMGTSEALAENVAPEKVDIQDTAERQTEVKHKKSFKQLKVIYKANEDSKLVASGNKTILNKGINKITEFSDEYILTKDRKTKLRNTKDDLLALNFGKLLNKSNRDLEN